MTITEFLAARLDEAEAAAKGPPGWRLEHWTAVRYADKASGRNWRVDAEPRCVVDAVARDDAAFIARHDPARVLREVEAKRKILAAFIMAEAARKPVEPPTYLTGLDDGRSDALRDTVRALAAVHSDHPDYRQEWA